MAEERILHGEVLAPEARGVRMPADTPFGVGLLGAMKFNAIRRVIEQYDRALRAKAAAIDAEGAVATAIARREVARVQLDNLDTIRAEETDRIIELAAIARLRRRLERMELEDQIADRGARREKLATPAAGKPAAPSAGVASDEFAEFMSDLRRMPEIVKAVASVKEQIVKDAGGEDRLSEAQRQACDTFDAMLQAFISKKAGDTAL